MRRSVIQGCGSYLPERVLTNAELADLVETTDDWIISRTGIRERRVAAAGEKTSDLAIAAARAALLAADTDPAELDFIIVATATPDETFPATATVVQKELGMHRGAAFDVHAVCSGFVYAMSVADNFIKAEAGNRILVIGAETFSRILDWEDRTTCVLFGDGAGAVVLEAREGTGAREDRGILQTCLHSDGRNHDALYVDGGPSSTQTTGYLRMNGKEVFRHAVVNLSSAIEEALDGVGLNVADLDWVVPHQANQRILDSTARRLGLPPEKVVSTIARHANTSAASVPLALADAVADGRIKPGHLVLMEAMGGGFTWGSCLVRW